jgi:XTP/dITP diphosphohydrolase
MNDTRLIAFKRLLDIMDELREQCPWDREQTTESIRHLTIEETYELSDAILQGDKKEIEKELGDLLLHIVFYAKIGSETNDYNIESIINQLCEKLIRRHPHIYGEVKVENSDDVKQNWEQIKLKEKGNVKKSVLSGVPQSMPSIVKAYRMQEKAAQVGFDWSDKIDVWNKVKEEMEEFHTAKNDKERTEEFGDLMFSLINYARFENINPDDALELTNKKFKQRFEYIEAAAEKKGKKIQDLSLEEMEALWQAAK